MATFLSAAPISGKQESVSVVTPPPARPLRQRPMLRSGRKKQKPRWGKAFLFPPRNRLDFALLSKLFNYARSDWGMENLQNPVTLAAKPKPAKGRERRLEKGEEEKLLEGASPAFRPIILFALETAMRRDEIASLQWVNVNFARRCALVVDTKNSETRTVPLSPAAIEILETLPRQENSDSVFGVTKDFITDNMKQLRSKTHIEDLRFHDLRHEAVSRLFENTDLDVMEVKTISGHRSMQMLARYSHLRTHRLADRLAGKRRGE